MPQPTEAIWPIDPHTTAKHTVLHGFLGGWFPVMLQGHFSGITYFEGFSGPGVYSGSEPGSPIIAIERFLEVYESRGPFRGQEVRFVFIEADERRFEVLEGLLEELRPRLPSNVHVFTANGRFQDLMDRELTRAGAWGQPIFANLDAWGADIPYEHVRRIAQNPSSEVFVTFLSTAFRKLAGRVEEMPKIDAMMGGPAWRAEIEQHPPGQPKIQYLTDEYRRTLNRAGLPITLAFELVDEGGHDLFLIFGTKSDKGLEVMKNAMWRVDRVSGLRFRDPRDPNQTVLLVEEEPNLEPLKRTLTAQLGKLGPTSVDDLKRFTWRETIYRGPHASTALAALQQQGRLDPEKARLIGRLVVQLRDGELG